VQLEVRLDGVTAGVLEYARDDDNWGDESLQLAIERKGLHVLRLDFVNDYNGPGGDRNAYVDWFSVQRLYR
jgi:hypothetical protein